MNIWQVGTLGYAAIEMLNGLDSEFHPSSPHRLSSEHGQDKPIATKQK